MYNDLGNINEKCISKLHNHGDLGSFNYKSFETCESYLLSKITKMPFSGKRPCACEALGSCATEVLELIHKDKCGPMTTQVIGGYSYFITFIDDYS